MPRGDNRPKGTPALPGAGRRPLALDQRKPNRRGNIAIEVAPETALLAQNLMLCNWPDVRTIADLIDYALRRLKDQT